jgi:cytochrome c-type biogenesis protein CcmH
MFWLLAVIIGGLAAGLMTWPILRERAAVRNYGLALVVAVPVVAILLYQQVGTPEGIGVTGTPQQQQAQQQQARHAGAGDVQFAELLRGLEQRLQDNPADVEGWVLLGRSYKTAQLYGQAETALIRAAQLAPNDAQVLVELAEAKLYTSGDPTIGAEVQAMLERALTIDPNQQKGLWLLGIAASQDGNDALAVELWERLVALMDPASGMAQSVQQQIEEARLRSGLQAPAETAAGGWAGIRVEVLANAELPELPPTAVLYVIARNPSMPGPPLGVMRLENPGFPTVAVLTDANSMIAELPLSGAGEIELSARLSMTGNVVAQPGDLQSDVVKTSPSAAGTVQLTLASN